MTSSPPNRDGDAGEWSVDNVLQAFWHPQPKGQVEVQDALGKSLGLKTQQQVQELFRRESNEDPKQAVCIPNIPGHIFDLVSPIAEHQGLHLLDKLVRAAPASTGVADDDVTSFSLLASKGFFLRPLVNPLGGTWFRCLAGKVKWGRVPGSTLTEQDWEDLQTATAASVLWEPSGKELREAAGTVILESSTALIDPLLDPSVFTMDFLEASYVEGGFYWDALTIFDTLRWLNKTYEHAAAKTLRRPSAKHLLAILVQLQLAVNKDPARFTQRSTVDDFRRELKSVMRKIVQLAQSEA